MTKSLYEIPPGCICRGDGLLGMKCDSTAHARLILRRGDVVRWRSGSYRVERVYQTEARIESVEYPGAFHLVSRTQLEKVCV